MLQRTFLHLWGIGPWREKALWAEGIHDWSVLQRHDSNASVQEGIRESFGALESRDLCKWTQLLPAREHWRLYGEFSDEALFFDVEADENRQLTVVSTLDADGFQVFVAGRNLQELQQVMRRRRLWVTYNGAAFDVPLVLSQLSEMAPPVLHLDLKLLGRRLKWFGGLKKIENKLGFVRPVHIQGVNGRDAILLWREFQTKGNPDALRWLVEYNAFDTLSLKWMMDKAFLKASEDLGWPQNTPEGLGAMETALDAVKTKLIRFGTGAGDAQQLIEKLRQEAGPSPKA